MRWKFTGKRLFTWFQPITPQICVDRYAFRMERSGGPQPNSPTLSPIVRQSHMLVLKMWYWVDNITHKILWKKVWPDIDLKETIRQIQNVEQSISIWPELLGKKKSKKEKGVKEEERREEWREKDNVIKEKRRYCFRLIITEGILTIK